MLGLSAWQASCRSVLFPGSVVGQQQEAAPAGSWGVARITAWFSIRSRESNGKYVVDCHRSGKCCFCGHHNDPEVAGESGDCNLCANQEGGGDMGLSLLFGDPSDSQGAAGGETEVTMTSTDLNLDLSQWRDLDIDMTNMDIDNGTEAALRGVIRALRGSQVKLTFHSPAHSTGGASLHYENGTCSQDRSLGRAEWSSLFHFVLET